MNERIKDLMIKSGAFDHYEVNEGVNGDELPMVKFAELIIRECAKAYHKTRLSKTPIETHFRNHFGIKE